MTSSSSRWMEEKHAMTSGVVPVRPPSYLPQMVKLPRRYEKAALGDPKTARHRKVSLCGPPLHMRQSYSDRVDDLLTAILWVKQELICLRQNDILLKRQFLDIGDSIKTIQRQEDAANNNNLLSSPLSSSLLLSSPSSSSTPTGKHRSKLNASDNTLNHTTATTTTTTNTTADNNNNNIENNINNNNTNNNNSNSPATPKFPTTTSSSPSLSLSSSPSPAQSPLTFKKKRQQQQQQQPNNGLRSNLCSSQSFLFDALLTARVSSSATVLNHHIDYNSDDDDSDGDDVFDTNFFRPRTSSMRTSRDLAALARRRGSKDLV